MVFHCQQPDLIQSYCSQRSSPLLTNGRLIWADRYIALHCIALHWMIQHEPMYELMVLWNSIPITSLPDWPDDMRVEVPLWNGAGMCILHLWSFRNRTKSRDVHKSTRLVLLEKKMTGTQSNKGAAGRHSWCEIGSCPTTPRPILGSHATWTRRGLTSRKRWLGLATARQPTRLPPVILGGKSKESLPKAIKQPRLWMVYADTGMTVSAGVELIPL